jgi:hypothetical protein
MKNYTKTTCLSLLLIIASTFSSYAQNFEFETKKYNWSETPESFTLDSSDKSYSTIYVFLKKYMEYATVGKENNVELYYVSHTLKYINDSKSLEDNNKIYLPVYQSQNLIGIQTRVINNGKVTFEATEKDFIQVEEDGKKYNMIALKGLAKGSMVETITKLHLDVDLYGNDYMQEQSPIKHAEFTLITAKEYEFRCKSYNGFSPIIDSIYEERRFSYAIHKNVPAMETDEKYANIRANKMRVEYVYSQNTETKKKYARWPELGRIFFDRIYTNYEKNEKELDKQLNKLGIKKMSTEAEKVFAIENFLKSNIAVERRANDAVLAADIFKRKYCSPYYMNQMFAQMLRKADINFELVLTSDKENKRFDPDLDSWSYLTDMIIYLPNSKQFIDPQATVYRAGKINSSFLGQSGLFIRTIQIGDAVTAMGSIKSIPDNPVEGSTDIENYTVDMNTAADEITLHYSRTMSGYAEQGLKSVYYLLDETERKKIFENFIKGLATDGTVTDLTVKNYNLSKKEEVEQPLIITANVKTSYYTEPVDDTKFLFKIGEVIGQQSEMYQEKPRQNLIDLSFTHVYKRTLTINIPAGYKIKGDDKLKINHTYKDSTGKDLYGFTSTYKIENNQLIVYCEEYYNQLTYPKQQFEDFKTVINAAADFNKISLLFEKQ